MNNTKSAYSKSSDTQSQPLLKVAIDVHLKSYVMAMQIDGSHPKPPQRFTPEDFLKWIEKKVGEGFQIISCYEAGPFGFVLHRQLEKLGVINHVIRARNWDDQRKGVKTDRTDALSMLNALDRFVAGNKHALAVVRVPTEEQERQRSQTRLQQSLKRDCRMILQRGRGLALQYGHRLKGRWHGPRNWPKLPVPSWLIELLLPLRTAALALEGEISQQTKAIESQSLSLRPKGMGALSQQIIEREVWDWKRFKNRRQVSSYLGLCPGENSSGARQQQGRVTKCGNPRLRWVLNELAWQLIIHQPEYRLCKKWRGQILDPKISKGRKKQLLVALARGFGVDWWRVRTAQTTGEKLGLKMVENPKVK